MVRTLLVTLAFGPVAFACTGQIGEGEVRFDGGAADRRVPETPDISVGEACGPRGFFEHYLWPEVLEAVCIDCHVQGGDAAMDAFTLLPAFGNADHLATNYTLVRALAERSVDSGLSLLEAKPTQQVAHGGGAPAPAGGRLHGLLRAFVERVRDDVPETDACTPPRGCEGVVLASPRRTLQRATLALGARIARDDELAAASDETSLALAVQSLLDEPAFVERVVEGFSDVFLIEGHEHVRGALLSYANFPLRSWADHGHPVPPVPVDPDDRYRLGRDYDLALRSEASALVRYIVANGRPFTEVLTADYTMLSPYTARGFGVFETMNVEGRFENPDDPFEFVPYRMPARSDRSGRVQSTPDGHYPHAGVLSTPGWLARYPSTETNRNRGRVRALYQQFLGVDILSLALPEDAASAMSTDNPTMESPSCVGCHRLMDPVAGLFQHYNDSGNFRVDHAPHETAAGERANVNEWHTDMFAPGFGGESFPEEDEWHALQWLAARVAADPRFATTMAEHALAILTQTPASGPPLDREDPLYRARLNGYNRRRRAVEDAANAFRAADFDLRAAFHSLVMSEAYRADAYTGESTPACDAELASLGVWSLLTPEQLNRKLEALFGRRVDALEYSRTDEYVRRALFVRSPDNENWYRIYGGIDRSAVTQRETTPNTVMGAIMRAIAQDTACEVVPPALDGAGLLGADLVDVPASLARLHEVLLHAAPDDDDVARSYALYTAIQRAGAARVAAGEEAVRARCGERNDEDYRVRAWVSVLSYLLRRPEFLLQ